MTLNIKELIEHGIEKGIDNKKMLMTLAKSTSGEMDPITAYMLLYEDVYGKTLCPKFCNWLVEHMNNGAEHGRKWTIEQTNELARKNSIEFGDDYTDSEFNTVVHMMYYDYSSDIKESGISSDNIYGKMADSYFTDPDAPKGKLVNHFFFVIRDIEK